MSLKIPGALTEEQLQEIKINWQQRGVLFPDRVMQLIQSLEAAYKRIRELTSVNN